MFYFLLILFDVIDWLIDCLSLQSLRLETGIFDGRPADYLFMLTFNWLLSVVVALFMKIPMLMDPMVLSVLYIWCQLNKVYYLHPRIFQGFDK